MGRAFYEWYMNSFIPSWHTKNSTRRETTVLEFKSEQPDSSYWNIANISDVHFGRDLNREECSVSKSINVSTYPKPRFAFQLSWVMLVLPMFSSFLYLLISL